MSKQDTSKTDQSKKHNLLDKQAISLEYSGDGAPRVTAKGQGHLAEQIIELANQNNIPITEDHELVALLAQVELDQEIPEVLYEAVAQVLIFAYELSGKSVPAKQDKNPAPADIP